MFVTLATPSQQLHEIALAPVPALEFREVGGLLRGPAQSGHAVDQPARLFVLAELDVPLDQRGVNHEGLVRMARGAGIGQRLLELRHTAMLLQGRPGRIEHPFLNQHPDHEIGRSVPAHALTRTQSRLEQRQSPLARGRAAELAQPRVQLEAGRLSKGSPQMGLGVRLAPRLRQEPDREQDQLFVPPVILEHPQSFLGVTQRLVFAAVLQAELGQPQVALRRTQILGAQRNAFVQIALALGEEIEDALESPIVANGLVDLRTPRQLLPGFDGKTPILGQSAVASTSA